MARRRVCTLLNHLPITSEAVASIAHEQQLGKFFAANGGSLVYVLRGVEGYRVMDVLRIENQVTGGDSSTVAEVVSDQLCRAALNFAQTEGIKVLPSCPYMRDRYLPEYIGRENLADIVLQYFDDATLGLEISVRLDGVATLLLSNSKRRNPLTRTILSRMCDFLQSCCAEFDEANMPPVRVIVLASTGPVFCSGHDYADLHGVGPEVHKEILDVCAEVNMLLQRVPQATLAAVDGLATAGGCQLVSSCDLVFASADNARFCLPGSRGGKGFCHTPLVGLADRLPSQRKAFELAILCEEIKATEAEQIGLVNRSIDGGSAGLAREVEKVALRLSRWFSPTTAKGKETFYRQSRAATLEEKYRIATPVMLDMFNTASQQQSMKDFLDGTTKKKRLARGLG